MATVKVAYSVSDDALTRVEAVVEHMLNYDCNWNSSKVSNEEDKQ